MLRFDEERRRVYCNGDRLLLQDKTWRVLQLIVARHPETLSRAELIDTVWQGNYSTGDKGLNQALWSIRTELGDDAREPNYIQTLPRQGYRWIGPVASPPTRRIKYAVAATLAVAFCAFVMEVGPTPPLTVSNYALPADCLPNTKSDTHAYRSDRDVIIDFPNHCRLVVKPSGNKQFGAPLVSANGQHVAFEVREEEGCKLVSLALTNGQRTEFDRCMTFSATET